MPVVNSDGLQQAASNPNTDDFDIENDTTAYVCQPDSYFNRFAHGYQQPDTHRQPFDADNDSRLCPLPIHCTFYPAAGIGTQPGGLPQGWTGMDLKCKNPASDLIGFTQLG